MIRKSSPVKYERRYSFLSYLLGVVFGLGMILVGETAMAAQFAYVVNDNSITTMSISPTTGKLSLVGTPMQLPGSTAIAISSGHDFLIALTHGSSGSYETSSLPTYSINQTTGELIFKAASSPAELGDMLMSDFLGLDPLGRFAYIGSSFVLGTYPMSSTLHGYAIDSSTGILTNTAGMNISSSPSHCTGVAFDKTGSYLYLVKDGLVYVVSVDQLSGVTTVVQKAEKPTDIPTGPLGIVMHPSGQFLYATGNGYVFWYQVDSITGQLTPSGHIDGIDPNPIAIEPTGKFLYIASKTANTLQVYDVNQNTGELTHVGNPVSAGTTPSHIYIDKFGSFAYVTNTGSNNIYVYSLDSTTGAMTLVQAQSTGLSSPKMLLGFSDATKPPLKITDFTIPETSSSLSVEITSLAVSDATNVSGYCLSETNSSTGCNWTVAKPTNYTFSLAGTKNLYAFAKDAGGNITPSVTAQTIIEMPTTTTTTTTSTSTTTSTTTTTTITQSLTSSGWGRPVPDTGQTTSYATGDDGYYSINPRSYTDNGDGTVTDNVTKLVWQQQDDGQQRTWDDAKGYCEALTLGGSTGWRLPNVQELGSLVDYGIDYPGPTFDHTVFSSASTSTQDDHSYWSSTLYADGSNNAWSISFNLFGAFHGSQQNKFYVRCLHSESVSWPLGFLVINNKDTATDVHTGLSWQRQDSGQPITWEQALSYCENLTLDGYNDWRLPSANELISIVDYDKVSSAIDQTVFPTTQSSTYWSHWSSTTSADSIGTACFVNFSDGFVWIGNKPSSYYVRCARSGPINGTMGALAISSPTQGSTIKDGTMHIAWSNPQNISGQVSISLSREGGKDGSWETITESTENDGAYDWAVTGLESVNCVLKIEPVGATDKVGYKGLFSIGAPQNTTTTTTTTTTSTNTTSSTGTTTGSTTTTTTITFVDQLNSTIKIYPVDGKTQDYYSISDKIKLVANYRDQEGFDLDVTGVTNWTSTNALIADVGNGISKGGAVTFKGNGEVRIFSFINGLMDYMDFKVGSADVAKNYGNLIILAGGKSNDAKDSLKEAIQYLCNRIYQVFKVRMFKDEDIYYINQKSDQDFNGDGVADGIVDQATKSVSALTQAVQWAKAQPNDGPLYLYLVDHGEKNGTFLIDSNQVLSAVQLKTMLDDFESTGRTSVVILEACYSGSFLSSLAGPNRVILTSANADKYSFIGADGKVSFDQFFSNHLMVGKSWEEAFDLAVEEMQSLGSPYSTMMPQKSIGAQVTMGKVYGDFTMASLFPEIKTYSLGDSVSAETIKDFSVQLDSTSTQGVEVWGMVTPPDYQPPTVTEEFGTPVVNLDKINLVPSEGGNDFMGQYTFPCAGAYSVTYYAKDSKGMVVASPPQTFTVSGKSCDATTTTTTSTSISSTTTTTIPGDEYANLSVHAGWNLLSSTIAFPVQSIFGNSSKFSSVWKWQNSNWAVYLPGEVGGAVNGGMTYNDSGGAYAQSKGFIVLTSIVSGEGFWVNGKTDEQVQVNGTPAYGELSLTSGWNLVGIKGTSPMVVADLGEVTSVWKWTTVNGTKTWAVNLPGEGDKGASYASSKGFGQFTIVEPGEGFWVNKPQ